MITKVKENVPYKKASRINHPENTVIKINGEEIVGGKKLMMIAGPCSVESEEQVIEIAKKVKKSGATVLRGGAFKPRTSPYAFQGLKYDGLELLKKAREATGLKIVTEIMSTDDIEIFDRDVDIIQVGARNMQNFDLLKKLGKLNKPVLLKRGLSATIEEWLMSAEYIMSEGNEQVILCERGIRTYETSMRNTLDISAIPMIKKLSHLPVIVDPSHAAGIRWMVEPLSKAAVSVGADGLIIEVHNDPEHALCDGPQSLKPQKYTELLRQIKGGDRASFQQLHDATYNHLTVVALNYLYSADDICDVLNEAYFRVFRYIDAYDGKGDGYNWICRIVQNVAYGHNKKHDVDADINRVEAHRLFYEVDDNIIDNASLFQAIKALNGEMQELIYLKFWEDLTFAEIASRKGMKKSTAHKKTSAALKIIENYLSEEE